MNDRPLAHQTEVPLFGEGGEVTPGEGRWLARKTRSTTGKILNNIMILPALLLRHDELGRNNVTTDLGLTVGGSEG